MSALNRLGIRSLVICGAMLISSFLLSACDQRSLPMTHASARAVSNYYLGPGDRVRVDVFGDNAMSGEHQVDADGEISMPLVGAVKAQGETSARLKSEIEKRLVEYVRDPKVSVQVLSYRPVYVVGEVKRPGSYQYVDGMTVINAIAFAGGYTYRAQKGAFIIDRKTTGDAVTADAATPLRPGDVVTVRERYF